MHIKEEKGLAVVDISISVMIITIFIAVIGNLIININLNSKDIERKTIAISYAVQEIEQIKSLGYIDEYDDKGINDEYIIEEDIITSDGNFSGYSKKVSIKDYTLIKNDNTKKSNLVKQVTVEIVYKLGNKDQNVKISSYVTKE